MKKAFAKFNINKGFRTGGRTRTDTLQGALDFESSASTNSTTPAFIKFYLNIFYLILILNTFRVVQLIPLIQRLLCKLISVVFLF